MSHPQAKNCTRPLPEFKGLKVGQSGQPLQRPMTVQDLLRHTSGLVYPFFAEDKSIVQFYLSANIYDYGQSLAEMVTKFAKLPLAHQPGTTWDYSMSTDVLGRIIEVVSGQDLDRFVQQRIAEPLHLQATGFRIAATRTRWWCWIAALAGCGWAYFPAPRSLRQHAGSGPATFTTFRLRSCRSSTPSISLDNV
jgi:CubicO group peptidase (beta-lactamase class C family)